MATLEEITQQFEDALTESTGTTIKPGTITPQGVTSSVSGKKKLSWPEIVEKITEGIGVRQNELLPEVPEGVSAQKFYRTAAQSGLLPSGLSTFTSSPFGSFRGRIGVVQGTKPDTSEPEFSVAPVVAPKSVIQTQRKADEGGLSFADEDTNYASPIANPDINLATFAKFFVSPGTTLMSMHQSENVYTTLEGYTAAQIDDMIATGAINEAQLAAYQQGITHMNSLGQPVDPDTGKVIDIDVYHQKAKDRFENHPVFGSKKPWIKPVLNLLGTGDAYSRGAFTPGYQKDGTWMSPSGQVSAMGTTASFQALADVDPFAALDVIDARGDGWFGISQENRDYVNQVLDQNYGQKDSFDYGGGSSGDSGSGGIDIGGPQAGDPDAPGEEDIGVGGGDGGVGGTDDSAGGDFGSDMGAGDWGSFYQEGGQVAQGAEADMSNLGMINEQAAQPQQGGAVSVKDDIPREADEGDYILPYETVLLVGLKDLNRYAREAIDLAMKNGVNLKGTDLDPTDDVPIKVSNYEYHIPKMLVPFFGGGKKYLDKIRQEGLDLRKRLEEEKQPSMQEQQPMAEAQPAPAPAQAAPAPQVPMMQQGGFVDDPQKKQMQTSAAVLEADASQQAPSAYNQMQALERTRRQAQQPPMVDPMGRVVQQGFAAPQGYEKGDEVKGVPIEEEKQTPMTEQIASPESRDKIGLDTFEDNLKPSIFSGSDPFMQKRTEPMREIEVDESGFTSDTVPVIDEPAEPKTAAPEEKATSSSQKMQEAKTIMSKFSKLHPVQMMALVAVGEARGDGIEGMRAVMHVINNRTKYGKRFGKTVPEVILAKKQFSAILPDLNDPEAYQGPQYENFMSMMNTKSNDNLYKQAKELAIRIIQGEDEDVTNGATHYYNPSALKEPPVWAKNMRQTYKVKSHLFFAINKKDGGFVDKVLDEAA